MNNATGPRLLRNTSVHNSASEKCAHDVSATSCFSAKASCPRVALRETQLAAITKWPYDQGTDLSPTGPGYARKRAHLRRLPDLQLSTNPAALAVPPGWGFRPWWVALPTTRKRISSIESKSPQTMVYKAELFGLRQNCRHDKRLGTSCSRSLEVKSVGLPSTASCRDSTKLEPRLSIVPTCRRGLRGHRGTMHGLGFLGFMPPDVPLDDAPVFSQV